MPDPADALPLRDHEPERARFLQEVLDGLGTQPKWLHCKWFYDERGSQLFDAICDLEEYYPTRTELAIMERGASQMAEALGPRCLLVEYGSGSSLKTRVLLDHLRDPAAYVPVDISREHLLSSATALVEEHPDLTVLPVCVDFTRPFEVPEPDPPVNRTVVYFPGSTIGNLRRNEARDFLADVAARVGAGGGLLIGTDLVKDPAVLERAYDDAKGVTAAFNLNLLRRINRELGADFELERFRHVAHWDPELERIEMHLESLADQRVRVDGHAFDFERGETIFTEASHKYRLPGFAELADEAGFDVERVWTDTRRWFAVQLLRAR